MYTILTTIQEFIMTYPIIWFILVDCLALVLIMFIKDRDIRKACYESLLQLAFLQSLFLLWVTPFVSKVLSWVTPFVSKVLSWLNYICYKLMHPIVYFMIQDLSWQVYMFFSLYLNLLYMVFLLGYCLYLFWTIFKQERMNNYPQGIMVAFLKASFPTVSAALVYLAFIYFPYL